jgi:hypothetical protein
MADIGNEAPLLRGLVSQSPVTDLYFSKTNIDALHDGIRYSVYRKTNGRYVIGRQSDTILQIVMRSTLLSSRQDASMSTLEKVRVLNSKVLDYCVDNVLGALSDQDHYLKDISRLPMPLEQSKNVSNAGTKVLYRDRLG